VGQPLISLLTRSIVSRAAGRPYLLANVRSDSAVRDQQSNSVGITISGLKWKRYLVLHTGYVPSEVAGRAELPRLLSIDNADVLTDAWSSFGHEQTRPILRLDGIDVGEACNTIHVTFRLRCHAQTHNSQHKSNNRNNVKSLSISTMLPQVQVLWIICGGIHHIQL
jgi:hypothetical protein